MAWTGHAGMHSPQVVHKAGSMAAPASEMEMACSGQLDMHFAQLLFGLTARRHEDVSSITPERLSSHFAKSDIGLSSSPFFFNCILARREFPVYAHCFTK